MHGDFERAAEREARWRAQLDLLSADGFTAPGLAAEVALTDIAKRYGPLVPVQRLSRAEARAAVRDGRVVGFRQERIMGSGDVFVVDTSREPGAEVAYVLPPPLRVGDVADALRTNPWESVSDLVAWLNDHGAIAPTDSPAR
jgi:hypothetical protein